ncbi:hypothetical protein ILYODFUR_011608 [Ilyodon furcidens]|uniref:THAP domain-containing protein 1 n=1 Tax=Ilyodon furcidens TaxID=33524 RepID=A0ABV0SXE0_9TELE
MGRYKCAYNCDHSTDPDVKFFKFPLYNPRKLRKWLSNMKWKDWAPTRFSVLCINHFEEQYIDRAGKCVTLREDAVPTIFSPHDKPQKNKASDGPGRRKRRPLGAKTPEKEPTPSATSPPVPTNSSVKIKELNQREEQHTGDKDQKNVEKWRIIVDERLRKIDSFPHFFHGDYCVPQNILWAPDGDFSADCEHSDDVIEVKEPWQWLGLDIRGPLPQTMNGHRLPHDIVHRINRDLKDHLKDIIALVVYHQQTGNVDLTTPQLIDRMVGDLMEEHSADWDVYLPAKVFSLCFKPHLATKERPFSLLCSKGLEPIQSPRGLDYVNSKIQDSAFVVRSKLVI